MQLKRIAVLMGGWGEEREISMKTGEAVAQALTRAGREVRRVMAGPGLERALPEADVDAVFVALHGRMGEDGKLQGLLEVLGLPYTGSGVLASALAMDKPMARKLFGHHNIATPLGYVVEAKDAASAEALHGDFGFPVVVKPACSGSSFGISVVRSQAGLVPAVEQAARFGGRALVERFVRGRELTVAILGDEVLGTCEIVAEGEVFGFAGKYEGGTRYLMPPRLSPTRLRNVENLAIASHRALGCRGYSRVDLIASESENDFVLEVNTLPGMTPTSLLPKIARAAGLGFEDLVLAILEKAAADEAGWRLKAVG